MKKVFGKKMISLLLASAMVVTGTTIATTGCGTSKKPVTLTVYSQLANYSGEQIGWSAQVLLKKFNVKLNIIPEQNGTFQTRSQNKDLGDIVLWGGDSADYPQAVKAGLLYDWNKNDLIGKYGPYIKAHMKDALAKNQKLTGTITNGKSNTLYGFGHNVATTSKDHDSFFYTWDNRWDLYKKLGYPTVKNLDDYENLLIKEQKICPKDDNGKKVYAVSLWPDWDGSMVMYVKATATAYYGYDEQGIGLYNVENGEYYDALQKNGPYLQMLKWYNNLYRDGLLDPDSMTQTYDQMATKVKNGGVLMSIFNYSGQLAYNTADHTKKGKLMYCIKPEDATPIVYGMSTLGGNRVWSIGSKTKYPDLAMKVINYLSTPKGWLTMEYGPEGKCWYYKDKHTYLTALGKQAQKNGAVKMGSGYTGSFKDGQLQINNTTWSKDASNPETDGETYNSANWKSTTSEKPSAIMQDWENKTGATSVNTYMEKGKYCVAKGTSYSDSEKPQTLKTVWKQVTGAIVTDSWKAIYSKTDKEYDAIVAKMIKDTAGYGYDKCIAFCKKDASRRKALEDALKN